MICFPIPSAILERKKRVWKGVSNEIMNRCPKRHDDTYKKMFLEDDNRSNFEKKYINETISKKKDLHIFFSIVYSSIIKSFKIIKATFKSNLFF